MADPEAVEIGLIGAAEMVVGTNDTAPRVGSGRIAVLATPVMINLIEEAALAAIEARLAPGVQSLGTRLDVTHVAPTPVGMTVRATAEVIAVEKRLVTFRVQARDAVGVIGEGHHDRVIVSTDRFLARVSARASGKN